MQCYFVAISCTSIKCNFVLSCHSLTTTHVYMTIFHFYPLLLYYHQYSQFAIAISLLYYSYTLAYYSYTIILFLYCVLRLSPPTNSFFFLQIQFHTLNKCKTNFACQFITTYSYILIAIFFVIQFFHSTHNISPTLIQCTIHFFHLQSNHCIQHNQIYQYCTQHHRVHTYNP